MSADAVLAAAADEVERWPQHHADREMRNVGGAAFTLLFEQAKRMYGWTAIQQLQRHLGGKLPHGHIQHWRETDRNVVVEALRAAAKEPVPADTEAQAARDALARFHRELGEEMGWLACDVTTLVREVGAEVRRLRRDNERLASELAEERKRAR